MGADGRYRKRLSAPEIESSASEPPMVDLTLSQDLSASPSSARLRRFHTGDRTFHRLSLACALVILVMFVGILLTLITGAWLRSKHSACLSCDRNLEPGHGAIRSAYAGFTGPS